MMLEPYQRDVERVARAIERAWSRTHASIRLDPDIAWKAWTPEAEAAIKACSEANQSSLDMGRYASAANPCICGPRPGGDDLGHDIECPMNPLAEERERMSRFINRSDDADPNAEVEHLREALKNIASRAHAALASSTKVTRCTGGKAASPNPSRQDTSPSSKDET
jgi:hypothetical protein